MLFRSLDLLYPPKCIHCNTLLAAHCLLCQECLDTFTLIPEEGRCSKCFAEIPTVTGICKPCRQIAHPFQKLGACFDAYGPAKSIANALLKQRHFHFAKDIASFIVIQLEALKYPSFDILTLVPSYFHTPHLIVAKEISRILNLPFRNLLIRHLTPYPSFSFRKKCNIINQKVLLLDISMQTRSTMRCAAWALDRGGPETIYGMTFCAT